VSTSDLREAGREPSRPRSRRAALSAHGEPFQWALGGALACGILLVVAFLILVVLNGVGAFYPKPIALLTLSDGTVAAGEPTRTEVFEPPGDELAALDEAWRSRIESEGGRATRQLYRIGNYDLYNEDFRWVPQYRVVSETYPGDFYLFERLEWGVFIGKPLRVVIDGVERDASTVTPADLRRAHGEARARWRELRRIERKEIGTVNRDLEAVRLDLRAAEIRFGKDDARYRSREQEAAGEIARLEAAYEDLARQAGEIRARDERFGIVLAEAGGREKTLRLSDITRYYPANSLGALQRIGVWLSRWGEFLSEEPREANTEGGVLPAIFGTAAMTLLMVVAVAPFGVLTALYLREYAKQGRLVSAVRISVNNLAGVPSIVYGVFGLGFFAYTIGVRVDELFYAERLPSPTFGTGGLLWSALTLALLTVPVVIVATEEALAAVPRSVREGSLACGASKWQTIRSIVLPQALPGVMTGLVLAMARGAGEVAPLMLVGVVKLAPELPVDGVFPFLHLERSFMHLGFHIYDVGFQSRNSEAGKPMVYVTTLLLIFLIALMNAGAIYARARLKRRFAASHF
jgi:phosphate transport system permease protein